MLGQLNARHKESPVTQTPSPPKGIGTATLTLAGIAAGGSLTEAVDTVLTEAKVAVVPGDAFMAEGYCRLSYAVSMANIQEGLRRIEAFVKKLS